MALFKVMSTFVVIVMLIVPSASWAPTLKSATRLAPTSRRRSCTVVRADDTGVAAGAGDETAAMAKLRETVERARGAADEWETSEFARFEVFMEVTEASGIVRGLREAGIEKDDLQTTLDLLWTAWREAGEQRRRLEAAGAWDATLAAFAERVAAGEAALEAEIDDDDFVGGLVGAFELDVNTLIDRAAGLSPGETAAEIEATNSIRETLEPDEALVLKWYFSRALPTVARTAKTRFKDSVLEEMELSMSEIRESLGDAVAADASDEEVFFKFFGEQIVGQSVFAGCVSLVILAAIAWAAWGALGALFVNVFGAPPPTDADLLAAPSAASNSVARSIDGLDVTKQAITNFFRR